MAACNPVKLLPVILKLSFIKFALMAVLAVSGIFKVANFKIFCKNTATQNQIDMLCQDYQDGKLGGDLCRDICAKDQELIKIGGCISLHVIKSLVFKAEWKGRKVVIKGDGVQERVLRDDESLFGTFETFQEKLIDKASSLLRLKVEWNDIKNKLWDVPITRNISQAEMRSAWQVLDSREHTLFRLLPWLGPRIVGSCGRLYAEEELQPMPYRLRVNPRGPSLEVKLAELKLSLKLLDFIERLNSGYLNESLLYYDFKLEHFALDEFGNVRMIDAGDLYSANETRNHKATKECQQDDDCRSGSSIGWCDLNKKMCHKAVANANLHLLCHRILLGKSQDVPVLKGLLQDHLPLRQKLNECASKSRLFRSSAGVTDAKIAKDLRTLIQNQISDIERAL